MSRKGVVVEFTTKMHAAFVAGKFHFPGPIVIGATSPCVAKDVVAVRIEADWLPDWAETLEGEWFPNAVLKVDDAGNVTEVIQGAERPCVPIAG